MIPLQLFAASFDVAERVLAQRRRFGHASTRHAAIYACRRHLEGAVRCGALTADRADAEARRAVRAVETEPVRVEAEQQGVFEHLRAGRRVTRNRDENGEWTLDTSRSHRGAIPAEIVNATLTRERDSAHEAAGPTPSVQIDGSGR